MKRLYKVTARVGGRWEPVRVLQRNGEWGTLGCIYAQSGVMARNIAINRMYGKFRGSPTTHRPIKGRAIYEYDNGALCVDCLEGV